MKTADITIGSEVAYGTPGDAARFALRRGIVVAKGLANYYGSFRETGGMHVGLAREDYNDSAVWHPVAVPAAQVQMLWSTWEPIRAAGLAAERKVTDEHHDRVEAANARLESINARLAALGLAPTRRKYGDDLAVTEATLRALLDRSKET